MFEAGGFDGKVIVVGRQIGHVVGPGGVGQPFINEFRPEVAYRELGAGDHGTGRITDIADDGGRAGGLGEPCGRREKG